MADFGMPAEYALGAASWRAREWLGWNATLDEGAPGRLRRLRPQPARGPLGAAPPERGSCSVAASSPDRDRADHAPLECKPVVIASTTQVRGCGCVQKGPGSINDARARLLLTQPVLRKPGDGGADRRQTGVVSADRSGIGASKIADVLPLLGLRVRTGPLELRGITDDDLVALCDLATQGIHPPERMPFLVPWTDVPAERAAAQHRAVPLAHAAPTSPPTAWALHLGVWHDGTLVGTQAFETRALPGDPDGGDRFVAGRGPTRGRASGP